MRILLDRLWCHLILLLHNIPLLQNVEVLDEFLISVGFPPTDQVGKSPVEAVGLNEANEKAENKKAKRRKPVFKVKPKGPNKAYSFYSELQNQFVVPSNKAQFEQVQLSGGQGQKVSKSSSTKVTAPASGVGSVTKSRRQATGAEGGVVGGASVGGGSTPREGPGSCILSQSLGEGGSVWGSRPLGAEAVGVGGSDGNSAEDGIGYSSSHSSSSDGMGARAE